MILETEVILKMIRHFIRKGIWDDWETCLEAILINCTEHCCVSSERAFQPVDKRTLLKLTSKKRNFQPQWYKKNSKVSFFQKGILPLLWI